ncbi:MAG TPA: N-6 DNA methylase [Candidatus Hydrogenedentes bacterium]|nr:N-6 DNA methylase [Candidatus Hydrogenedentota bacterium]
MPVKPVTRYLREIEKQLATGLSTEHTHRAALQQLVESCKRGVMVTNEPARSACGAPDYIVTQDQVALGYIEAKDIGKNLDEVERSEQLKRYLDGLPNLILTDYLEFRLYQSGEFVMEARLARPAPGGKLKLNQTGEKYFTELLEAFFNASFPLVATPHDLAERMAATARMLRDVIERAFEQEGHSDTLHGQLEAFRRVLLHDLAPAQFADMYAQTICYGLFAACCNHKPSRGRFVREAAIYELPETNPFLRQMFGHIAGPSLDIRLSWAVDHLAHLLDQSDMGSILRDFGKRTRQEDPVVHFYETFLAAYDPSLRETRGVYYTPEPVVSYIVRSIDKILRKNFGVCDGLASTEKIPLADAARTSPARHKPAEEIHRVLILDPATGTGTFLHGVVDHIHDTICRKSGAGAWNSYVSGHLLPRLFGFELLMAPYAVAHMKLGIQLAETGYTFQSGERLRVYLTNTLEEAFALGDLPLFANLIAEEANAAGQIKTKHPVMVILGNPPYSGHSVNKGKWISQLIDEYKKDYKDLKKPGQAKWLSDDYVKFIRFAQWRIERTGYGILAFISNHSYLDNPTFHGMRRSLMNTFDEIFILNLHGNTKKKERSPDGTKDENVFDIQQGVAIGIFVKRKGAQNKKPALVYHADMWGLREIWENEPNGSRNLVGGKYRALYDKDVFSIQWERLEPGEPFQLFIPQQKQLLGEYQQGWSIADIFRPYGDPAPGIVTTHDDFAISWSPDEAIQKVNSLLNSKTEDEARELFHLCSQDQWNYTRAKEDLKTGEWKRKIVPILYRPFDFRWTIYNRNVAVHLRARVTRHMLAGENLGLYTCRQTVLHNWQHVFITRHIVDDCYVSNRTRERGYLFPLYLYPKEVDEIEDLEELAVREESDRYGIRRRPNLAPEFIQELSSKLKCAFVEDKIGDLKKTFGPEDVFHYIYALFHSPAYRERYVQFLKIDFPRVPVTSNRPLFRELCTLGRQLTTLHLLESGNGTPVTYPVEGANMVQCPRYVEMQQRVYINDTQYFGGIPPAVWEFCIGGYQVCHKWLKDRRGRVLTYDDIAHYGKIVAALADTMDLMGQIDSAIASHGGWPIQ